MARALLFFILFIASALQAQNSKLIAISDCGRCSGTAYSNCNGCKHCNSGFTCGVSTSYKTPLKNLNEACKKRASTLTTSTASCYKKNSSKKAYANNAPTNKTVQGFSVTATRHLGRDKLNVTSDILNLFESSVMDFSDYRVNHRKK